MLALGETLLLAVFSFAIWWIALRSVSADHEARRTSVPASLRRWDQRGGKTGTS